MPKTLSNNVLGHANERDENISENGWSQLRFKSGIFQTQTRRGIRYICVTVQWQSVVEIRTGNN
jgi:very-short-patch-repair endonuclease